MSRQSSDKKQMRPPVRLYAGKKLNAKHFRIERKLSFLFERKIVLVTRGIAGESCEVKKRAFLKVCANNESDRRTAAVRAPISPIHFAVC
jgi:hypothetical protein